MQTHHRGPRVDVANLLEARLAVAPGRVARRPPKCCRFGPRRVGVQAVRVRRRRRAARVLPRARWRNRGGLDRGGLVRRAVLVARERVERTDCEDRPRRSKDGWRTESDERRRRSEDGGRTESEESRRRSEDGRADGRSEASSVVGEPGEHLSGFAERQRESKEVEKERERVSGPSERQPHRLENEPFRHRRLARTPADWSKPERHAPDRQEPCDEL